METKTLKPKLSTVLWIGLISSLLVRLLIAWAPVNRSFSLSVPDDAYYYFTIARNIAAGEGVTFDGLAPTNGFHPLWMTLIVPLWLVAGEDVTLPVHLALTLGVLLDVATIAGIWRLAKTLAVDHIVAALAVLVYAWNPYNLAASVNGLETSLGASLFVWSLVVYWNLRSDEDTTWQKWLTLGSLWALLLLARTDYLIIIAPCGVDLLWRRRHQFHRMWVAALGGLIWIPWLAWNIETFGSFSQVSGKAYPYYLHTIWESEGHTLQEWLLKEAKMAYGIVANLARLSGFDKAIVLLALVSGYLVYTTFLSRKKPQSGSACMQLSGLIFPTLGAISLLMIHGLMRWMYIPWYFVPSAILLTLWFAEALKWLGEQRKWLAVMIGFGLLVFQILSGVGLWLQGGMWPEQALVVKMATPELIEVCNEVDLIGISDAGYYGYYLPCQVVNLDGVVNNQAFEAIREERFRHYLDATDIQYVKLNHIIRRVVMLEEGEVPSTPPFVSPEP